MSEDIRVRYIIDQSSYEAVLKKTKEVSDAVEVLHQRIAELKKLKLGIEVKADQSE